jgi:acyl CoA:acetate/3-ketoacid CoA transferase alpha subunit
MINTIVASPEVAVADIVDGASIMIGGFCSAGMPTELIDSLLRQAEGLCVHELERMTGLALRGVPALGWHETRLHL